MIEENNKEMNEIKLTEIDNVCCIDETKQII
jgi:hypothetical protein